MNGYELDTLLEEDWSAFGRVIRGPISLWTAYSRRWRSIRAKVFLRSDFYGRFTDVVGADIAKPAANRVELSWSDRYLLTVLLRRFGSADAKLRRYAELGGVRFRRDDLLGYLPEVCQGPAEQIRGRIGESDPAIGPCGSPRTSAAASSRRRRR